MHQLKHWWYRRRRRRPPRVQALPVSAWHVLLAFVDLLTDTLGAFSTRAIAMQIPRLCGTRLAAFFNCCFGIQLLLIAGSLAVQSVLAANHALLEEREREVKAAAAAGSLTAGGKAPKQAPSAPPATLTAAAAAAAAKQGGGGGGTTAASAPKHAPSSAAAAAAAAGGSPKGRRARAVAWAIFRGVTGTELAYQEFWRRRAPSVLRTAAVLQVRLAELVFEGPQVVMSWMVVLGRVTIEELARASGDAMPLSSNIKTLQWVSAITGLASLSVATADFMRVHGRSFWAGPPPDVLFLGILDVTRTSWWRSLLIGAHAFASLAARALLFIMLSLTLNVAFFDARHNPATAAVVGPLAAGLPRDAGYGHWPTLLLQTVMTAGMVASVGINAALLSGMRSIVVVPCAIVNGFCNIPWAAVPDGSPLFDSPCAIWPAWVMQAFYGGVTVALGLSSGWPTRYVSPCKALPGQPEVGGYALAYINWRGSARPDAQWGGTPEVVAVPLAAVAAEVTLFCIVNAVVWRERAAAGGKRRPCCLCFPGACPGATSCLGRPPGGGAGGVEEEEEEEGAGADGSDGGVGGRRPSTAGKISISRASSATSAATPALAYRFNWFRWPYPLCSVRIGTPSAPGGVVGPLPLPLQMAQSLPPQGQEPPEPPPS